MFISILYDTAAKLTVLSRLVIKISSGIALLFCSAAVAEYVFGDIFFGDVTTAGIIAEELVRAAFDCITGGCIPVFLAEILKRV